MSTGRGAVAVLYSWDDNRRSDVAAAVHHTLHGTSTYGHVDLSRSALKFRLCVLVYRCLNGSAPSYLAETICPVSSHSTRHRLRSAGSSTVLIPSTCRSTLGDRAFPVAAAKAWNSLPDHVRDATSVLAFRCQLKTVLFRQSYS